MPKTPPYSKEFRAEAVRLLRSSGRPIPQLARELGCSEQSLRNWSRQVDVDDIGDYGRTLRANDFLWGRMDAAVGIVDLLVDAVRARRFASAADPPWRALARELNRPDRAWLTAERMPAMSAGQTRGQLEAVLEQELRGGSGTLTRVLCVRAAQLEVLAEELPALIAPAREESSARLLDLDAAAPVEELVRKLRVGPTWRARLLGEPSEVQASALRPPQQLSGVAKLAR